MYCSKCGKDNKEDALFCVSCGKRFKVDGNCPICGSEVKKEEEFCPSCGHNMSGKKNKSLTSTLKTVMCILSFCVLPLIVIFGFFEFYYGYNLHDSIGYVCYFLLITLFIAIITSGILTLVTKSKSTEIVHDALSVFVSLFLFFILTNIFLELSIEVNGIIIYILNLLYFIIMTVFTIIKMCKKGYKG